MKARDLIESTVVPGGTNRNLWADDPDPVGKAQERVRSQIRELEVDLQNCESDVACSALEREIERLRDSLWDMRQREFDRDATGQDEEAFYDRFGLSGDDPVHIE